MQPQGLNGVEEEGETQRAQAFLTLMEDFSAALTNTLRRQSQISQVRLSVAKLTAQLNRHISWNVVWGILLR